MTHEQRQAQKQCEIDGVQYELKPMAAGNCCVGCVGKPDKKLCAALPACASCLRADRLRGIWIISGSQWHDPRVIRPDDGREVIARLDATELEVVGAIYDSGKWYYCEEDARQEIEYPVIGWLTRAEAAAILDGGLYK